MALPPYSRVEEAPLQALIVSHTIAGWRYDGERSERLVLTLSPALRQVQLAIPVRMQRAGQYAISAVELRDARGRLLGTAGPTVTVDEPR